MAARAETVSVGVQASMPVVGHYDSTAQKRALSPVAGRMTPMSLRRSSSCILSNQESETRTAGSSVDAAHSGPRNCVPVETQTYVAPTGRVPGHHIAIQTVYSQYILAPSQSSSLNLMASNRDDSASNVELRPQDTTRGENNPQSPSGLRHSSLDTASSLASFPPLGSHTTPPAMQAGTGMANKDDHGSHGFQREMSHDSQIAPRPASRASKSTLSSVENSASPQLVSRDIPAELGPWSLAPHEASGKLAPSGISAASSVFPKQAVLSRNVDQRSFAASSRSPLGPNTAAALSPETVPRCTISSDGPACESREREGKSASENNDGRPTEKGFHLDRSPQQYEDTASDSDMPSKTEPNYDADADASDAEMCVPRKGSSHYARRRSSRSAEMHVSNMNAGGNRELGQRRKAQEEPRKQISVEKTPQVVLSHLQKSITDSYEPRGKSLKWIRMTITEIMEKGAQMFANSSLPWEDEGASFVEFAYNFHLFKYGIRSMAEMYYVDFIFAMKKFTTGCQRCKTFARLLRLSDWMGVDQGNIDDLTFRFCLQTHQILSTRVTSRSRSSQGFKLISPQSVGEVFPKIWENYPTEVVDRAFQWLEMNNRQFAANKPVEVDDVLFLLTDFRSTL
eukprot:ANDGO_04055.mRNA.1 hypothetical protein